GHESSRGSDRCTPRAVGSGRQAPQSPSLPGPRIAPGLPGVVPAARPEGDVGPQSPFEQAVRQHQAGDLIGAERNYLQTLALDPAPADAGCNLGVLQSARSRPAEAAECYRRALQARPRHPVATFNLGVALLRVGRPAEALSWFEAARMLTPPTDQLTAQTGYALPDLGRDAEAAACLGDYLRTRPDDARAWHRLGHVLARLGR